MSGYIIKPPNPRSNILKLDVNAMTLGTGINTGLMVLKQSPGTDSNYTMTLQNIDASNILIRSASLSSDATQYVTSNLYVVNDISLAGQLYINNNDVTANKRLFVGQDVSLNSRLFVASDISANSRLFVGQDVSLNKRLYVASDISGNGRLNITGDASFNGGITVAGITTITGNITSSGNVFSQFVDAVGTNANIYVGPTNAGNVNIGSFINTLASRTINIGNRNDTVILSGNVINKSVATLQIVSPTLLVNQGATGNGTSAAAGIYINDNSYNKSGFILVSTDMSGYILQPPNPGSTSIKLALNSMPLPSGINTGLVVLKKTTGVGLDTDASYTMTMQNIDASNILIRSANLSTDATQYVTSNLSVVNDLSLAGRLYINNSDISANKRMFIGQDVSLNSRLYVASDISANSRVFVGQDVSLNSRLFVGGVTTCSGNIIANSDISANGRIFVGNDVSVNGDLYVSNNLTLGGIVNFIGLSIGSNTDHPNTTLDVSGNIEQMYGVVFQF
jgi:predicted acyltransferase (DUF342 family)